MAYTEDQMISRVATVLNDTATAVWGTAEIRAHMDQEIRELSLYSPNDARATVTFASGTVKELSLSSLSDCIDYDSIDIEYEINQDPKAFRNFTVRGSTAYVDISFWPSSGDTAFIYYPTIHTVSGTATNTMNVIEENLLIQLTAGEAQISKSGTVIHQILSAISDVASSGTAISAMTAQLSSATAHIALGRTEVDKMSALILTGGTAITTVVNHINAGTAYISEAETEADKIDELILSGGTAILAVTNVLTAATASEGSAGTEFLKASTAILQAGTEFDLYNAQVDLATAALNSASALINTVPVAGGAAEWMNQAGGLLGNAAGFGQSGQAYVQKFNGYMNAVQALVAISGRELNEALAYVQQGQAYFQEANTVGNNAGVLLNLAKERFEAAYAKIREAQASFEQARANASTGEAYGSVVVRDIQVAGGYANQSAAYLKQISSRINLTTAGRELRLMGEARKAKALQTLENMAKPKVYTRYITEKTSG